MRPGEVSDGRGEPAWGGEVHWSLPRLQAQACRENACRCPHSTSASIFSSVSLHLSAEPLRWKGLSPPNRAEKMEPGVAGWKQVPHWQIKLLGLQRLLLMCELAFLPPLAWCVLACLSQIRAWPAGLWATSFPPLKSGSSPVLPLKWGSWTEQKTDLCRQFHPLHKR